MSDPLPPAPPPSPTGSLHSSNMPAIAHSPFAASFDPSSLEETPNEFPLPTLSLDDAVVLPKSDEMSSTSEWETLSRTFPQTVEETPAPSPDTDVKPLIRFPTNHTHVTLPQHTREHDPKQKKGRRTRSSMCATSFYILFFLALLAWLIAFLVLRQKAKASHQAAVIPTETVTTPSAPPPVFLEPEVTHVANLTTNPSAPSRHPFRKLVKTLGTHAIVGAAAYTLATPRRSRPT